MASSSIVIRILLTGTVVGLSIGQLKPDAVREKVSTYQNIPQRYSDQHSHDFPINFDEGLLVKVYGYRIEAFDDYNDVTIPLVDMGFQGFDIYSNKTIYYSSEVPDCAISSLSKNYPKLTQPDYLWYCPSVTTLAVNPKFEIVYAYDDEMHKIDLFDIGGKHHSIVLSDIRHVKDIVVHPLGLQIYILRSSPRTGEGQILSANADGTELQEFVSGTNMTAIAISQTTHDLYWTQNNSNIITSDNNKNIQKVLTTPNTIISIAIRYNFLYFTCDDNLNIIYRCYSTHGICIKLQKIPHENPRQLKAFDLKSNFNIKSNICEKNNGACDHFCLPTQIIETDRNYRCACDIGWELSSDKRTCSPVNEYILYIQEFAVRGRILDVTKESFVDAIIPRRLESIILASKSAVDLDINVHKGYLILSDDFRMYLVDLFGWNKQKEIYNYDTTHFLYPAIDWVTDNLYFLRANKNNDTSYLVVQHHNTVYSPNHQKTMYTFAKEESPRALVLSPYLGFLFVAVYNRKQKEALIYRMNMDGSDSRPFPKGIENVSVNEVALGMDHLEHRIYWFIKDKSMIQHTTLVDTRDLKSIDVSFVKDPETINIHRQWIYISNRFEVWRVLKRTGDSMRTILSSNERGMLSAAKGYGSNLQPVRPDNPCAIDNGGCQQYCFVVPNLARKTLDRVCTCNDNEELQSDKKACKIKPLSDEL